MHKNLQPKPQLRRAKPTCVTEAPEDLLSNTEHGRRTYREPAQRACLFWRLPMMAGARLLQAALPPMPEADLQATCELLETTAAATFWPVSKPINLVHKVLTFCIGKFTCFAACAASSLLGCDSC